MASGAVPASNGNADIESGWQTNVEVRLSSLETRAGRTEEDFHYVRTRLDEVATNTATLATNIGSLQGKVDGLPGKGWLIATVIAIFLLAFTAFGAGVALDFITVPK